jgi:hypothetical protein
MFDGGAISKREQSAHNGEPSDAGPGPRCM